MNKKLYLLLFILCILSITGVLLQSSEFMKTMNYNIEHNISPIIRISEFPLFIMSMITSFITTIWGLILAFRRRQWLWFISFLIFTFYSIALYSLLNFIRLNNKKEYEI